jgi:hypothetical protein
MAVDTVQRRLSIVNLGSPFRGILPLPDGAIEAEDRYTSVGLYGGNIGTAPQSAGQIPNFSAGFGTGAHAYDISAYFSGATSYAISPSVEAGWTFATDVGLLTIDTDAAGTFGPYTVTASNASGDTVGNVFTVKVSESSVRPYRGLRRGIRNYW